MRTLVLELSGNDEDKIERAAGIIKAGGLVAFPTETVYGLGADALREEAAEKIYAAKGRPSDNPLIVHIADRQQVYRLAARVSETAERLMDAFWPGPLTLIFPKTDLVPRGTTGGLDTVAVRMPSHETASALIRVCGVPVAAPSANTSGRPSPTEAAHVLEDLDGKIDCVLDGGPVGIGLESTIIDVTDTVPVILRPGSVSREMAEAVTGGLVLTDKAVEQPLSPDIAPKAPGMKYRHYAPCAPVTIVTGRDPKKVAEQINQWIVQNEYAGILCGVICTEETRKFYIKGIVHTVGSAAVPETIAHNLYSVLRSFDSENVGQIFSESFDNGPLAPAIMNRMKKAAGYHIVEVQ